MRKQFERDAETFHADAYRVKGEGAIAWRILGWETEPGPCEQWIDGEYCYDPEPEPVRTGRVVAIMVGDDRHFAFDPDDLIPISREAYCGECGQIGCTHDGLDRSE